MMTILPLMFCVFSVGLATQVTRTHYRAHGSPVPQSRGSPLPPHSAGIETDKYEFEFDSLVKRDEAPTTVPTRTHHRGHGSPLPQHRAGIEIDKYEFEVASLVKRDEAPTTVPTKTFYRSHGSPGSGSPVPYSKAESLLDLESNPEASSIAENIYEILEEYESELEGASSHASLPTDFPSGLVERSPDTVTSPPDGHQPVTYNFSGPFGTQNLQASLTTSISEEEVISAEDPPFHRRGGPAHRWGLTNVFSNFMPKKRMQEQPDVVGGTNANAHVKAGST